MYYVYILQSLKEGNFYTGFTTNIEKRIDQHNNREEFSTRNRTPFKMIYYEFCLEKHDAIVREKYLKSGIGKKYLSSRLKAFLSKG